MFRLSSNWTKPMVRARDERGLLDGREDNGTGKLNER
jgi:hypothetical protein